MVCQVISLMCSINELYNKATYGDLFIYFPFLQHQQQNVVKFSNPHLITPLLPNKRKILCFCKNFCTFNVYFQWKLLKSNIKIVFYVSLNKLIF